MIKFVSFILTISIFVFSTSSALAQTQTKQQDFEAEMLMQENKSTKEENITIQLKDNEVVFFSNKAGVTKTFKYTDITKAEYTYNKKPRYTTGAVLAMAVSVFLLPLMFTKSKKHWLTVQTDKDYAVLKLKKSNYRMLLPALESKGVKVTDLGDQNKKEDDNKDKNE